MNKFIGIGRLTAKPELNYTPNQTAVTKFTVAIDKHTKEGGADFIRVTAFGRQAETICRYLDKGRMVAIDGRITTGSYKGRDGKVVYTTEVTADRVEFLGNHSNENIRAEEREDREEQAKQIEQKAQELFGTDFQMDDIPF